MVKKEKKLKIPKKVIIIGNGHIIKVGNQFYINSHTGRFLLELVDFNYSIVYTQFYEENSAPKNLSEFELSNRQGIIINNLPGNSSSKLSKFKAYAFSFYNVIKTKGDFFYCFYPGTLSKIVALICLFTNRKYGLYIRGDFSLNIFNKIIIKNSSFILTVSQYFKDILFPINNKVDVIAPMLDLKTEDIWHERKIEKKDIYNLLFVGRVEKAKGIYELIEAVSNMKNVKLRIIGDGPDFNNIKELIDSNKITNIELIGLISDRKELFNFYKKSDIFVLPTHHEGFPRVLYEAMTFGLPIITTFVGGISSVMVRDYNALEIKVTDLNSIRQIIIKLCSDTELNKSLSNNAIKTMEEIFSRRTKSHHQLFHTGLNHEKI